MQSWFRLSRCLGFFALPMLLLPSAVAHAQTKVACVGDSITYGYGLAAGESYPSVLQNLLGSEYEVGNFGTNGATALKNGDNPYWNNQVYTGSDTFDPDIVVIMLGTNDSKPDNWLHEAEFEGDYTDLVAHYVDGGAEVYVALPPPAYNNTSYWQVAEVVPHVENVATTGGLNLIDVNAAMSGVPGEFADDVHPNAAGAQHLAQTVYEALSAPASGGAGGAGGTAGTAGTASGGGGASGAGGSAGKAGAGGASGGASGAAGSGGGGAGSAGSPSGGSMLSSGGAAGGTPAAASSDEESGCGCRNARSGDHTSGQATLVSLLALGLVARRRKRAQALSR